MLCAFTCTSWVHVRTCTWHCTCTVCTCSHALDHNNIVAVFFSSFTSDSTAVNVHVHVVHSSTHSYQDGCIPVLNTASEGIAIRYIPYSGKFLWEKICANHLQVRFHNFFSRIAESPITTPTILNFRDENFHERPPISEIRENSLPQQRPTIR